MVHFNEKIVIVNISGQSFWLNLNYINIKAKLRAIGVKMNESAPFEEVSYFTGLDYTIFISILSCSLAIGVYFGFFSNELKTAEDYLVGGHKMRTIPIAISLVSRWFQEISVPFNST